MLFDQERDQSDDYSEDYSSATSSSTSSTTSLSDSYFPTQLSFTYLGGTYEIGQLLGTGSHADVYEAILNEMSELILETQHLPQTMAIKVEPADVKHPSLPQEAEITETLCSLPGVRFLYDFTYSNLF